MVLAALPGDRAGHMRFTEDIGLADHCYLFEWLCKERPTLVSAFSQSGEDRHRDGNQ